MRRASSPMMVCSVFRLIVSCLLLAHAIPARGQEAVTTYAHDNLRSGVYTDATLTTSNVNVNSFGLLFDLPTYGTADEQPLYIPALNIAGQTHNVLFCATVEDEAYAFDADTGILLWSRFLGVCPGNYAVGVLSTPVIDQSTDTMYVVSYTVGSTGNVYSLHALNLVDGTDKFGGPIKIAASVPGTGYDNVIGTITFNAEQEVQRPALTLANGTVYVAFGSFADIDPWHGWVFAYNASNLSLKAAFNTTPDSGEGGIWDSGQGFVVDSANNLYFMVGNSSESLENKSADYGESFVKLTPTGNSLVATDYFKPNDFDFLNSTDGDVGAGGPVAIPGTPYIVGGGKEGILYVVNTNKMGHLNLSKDQVVQEFQAEDGLWGSPIFWNGSNPTLFVWGLGGGLKAFSFVNGLFNTTPTSIGSPTIGAGVLGGVGLALSTNQNTTGTNIVWANAGGVGGAPTSTGELFAFDATDLKTMLWSSGQNAARDSLGEFSRYARPMIAGGKVYIPNLQDELAVYGVFAPSPPEAPELTATANSSQVDLLWNALPGATGYNIYRTAGGNSRQFSLIASVSTTDTFADTTVKNGFSYAYEVKAVNHNGSSPMSNSVSALPEANEGTSIAVPTIYYSPGQEFSVGAILSNNATSKPIAGEVLELFVNGIGIGSATTDSNGVARVDAGISTEQFNTTYNLTFAFAGSGSFGPSQGSGNLLLSGKLTTLAVSSFTVHPGQSVTIMAKLTTTTGSVVANAPVEFSVVQTTFGYATTGADGIASLSATAPFNELPGVYPLRAYFDGNGSCSACTGTGEITLTYIVPSLTSLSGYSVTAGSPGFTGSVVGTGFVNGSTALANGIPLPTTFVNANKVSVSIPASDLLNPETVKVTVRQPDGTLSSNFLTFTIVAPSAKSGIKIL